MFWILREFDENRIVSLDYSIRYDFTKKDDVRDNEHNALIRFDGAYYY